MRLLTTDQRYKAVERREWPLAGLKAHRGSPFQPSSVKLVDGPGGDPKRVSYAQLYRENPWVYSCVNKLAEGIERLPFRVARFLEEGGKETIRPTRFAQGRPNAGQQLARLLDNPAPRISGAELRHRTALDYSIYGNALWYFDMADFELWHVPWAHVSVHIGENEPIVGYGVEGSGLKTRTLAPEDCVHFGRGSDPEDILGMSPLKPLARSAGLLDAIHRYLLAYFKNQVRPSGNMKLPPGSDRTVLEFVRTEIEALYSNPEHAGRPIVTTGEYQSLHAEPQHTESLKLQSLAREEVCATLGVPVDLLTGSPTKANVSEFRRMLYHDVVGPKASRMEADMRSQLLPMNSAWSLLDVSFDFDSMTRPSMQERGQAYRLMRFVYKLNELRAREGLPPIDDPRADVVWLPANEIPLTEETLEQQGGDQSQPNEFGDGVPAEDQRVYVPVGP